MVDHWGKSVQNRDARAVDDPSEQCVMVMMVGCTPVPKIQGAVEDALPQPPNGFHHEIPLLCGEAAQPVREELRQKLEQ